MRTRSGASPVCCVPPASSLRLLRAVAYRVAHKLGEAARGKVAEPRAQRVADGGRDRVEHRERLRALASLAAARA